MATPLNEADPQPVCEMNTTPLIDVMLVLLIMFILTVPIMTHAVKLDLPSPKPPPQVLTPPEIIYLDVDFDGTIVWNGTTVQSQRTLEAYLKAAAAKDPQPEIHFRPDGRARYGVVVQVLAAAQRNHLRKIGFVNTGTFRD